MSSSPRPCWRLVLVRNGKVPTARPTTPSSQLPALFGAPKIRICLERLHDVSTGRQSLRMLSCFLHCGSQRVLTTYISGSFSTVRCRVAGTEYICLLATYCYCYRHQRNQASLLCLCLACPCWLRPSPSTPHPHPQPSFSRLAWPGLLNVALLPFLIS